MAQIKISGLPAGVPNNDIEIPATNPNDLATPTGKTFKYYLTDLITFILNAQGFDTYSSCRVATDVALTAVYANGAMGVGATLTNSGAQAPLAIDGITLSLGDRVLVKDQAASAQNGIYFVSNTGSLATNWVLTRATDFDQGTEIIYLSVVPVNQGATNAGIIFQEASEGPFVMGTSAITFAPLQVSSVTQKQVQESAFNFAIAGGVNNVFTANLLPDATAYTDGLLVTLSTGALTNTIGNPTLNVNGLGAKTITFNGLQLEPGDIEPNTTYVLVYDLNNDYFNIINPTISIANTRLIQYNEYNAATDTGIADAYVANITPPITSLTGFLSILCKITNANTGASTLTVNGQTAGIVTANNSALIGGELKANQVALFLYDSTWAKFILVNPAIMTVGMGGTGNTSVGANGTLAQSDGTKYTFTTATYPATTSINHILYSSANNVIGQIADTVGGVLVSNNTGVPSMLANPADNYRVLQSKNAAIPEWSVAAYPHTAGASGTLMQSDGTDWTNTQATYPSSTNKDHILYSSANNTVGEIATQKDAVLVSNHSNTPVWSSSMTDGQIIIGKTNDIPAAASITGSGSITVTPGPNSLTISSSASGTVNAGTANQLAYYATTGSAVSGLATANSATLVTSSTGVPAWTSSMTNGQILIGSTGATPVPATLTAGPGISIANAAGSITISGTGSGIGWTEVTGTSQTMIADAGYVSSNAGLVTLTLPTTAAFGTVINVQGKGAGGWKIAQNAGQVIHFGSVDTTTGATGYLASTNRYDSIQLLCITANTDWAVMTTQGVVTYN